MYPSLNKLYFSWFTVFTFLFLVQQNKTIELDLRQPSVWVVAQGRWCPVDSS